MKKITIKGKERTLTCNMRALVTYQRVTGVNPFDLDSHNDEQKAMYDFVMGWSMLSKADQDEVQLDDIMESLDTMQKQHEFSEAVAAELTRFYKNEPGDADTTDRHPIDESEHDDAPEYEKNE